MSQRSKSSMKSYKNTQLATNGANAITASIHRAVLEDVCDSVPFLSDVGQSYKAIVPVVAGATFYGCGGTPLTMIAAPGADKFLNIKNVCVSYKFNSVAYNFGTTESIIFHVASSSDAVFTILYTVMNAGSSFNKVLSLKGGTSDSMDAVVNQAFVMTTADGGDGTAGDGTMDVIIEYTIEDVKA
jgi:hypothetical protein